MSVSDDNKRAFLESPKAIMEISDGATGRLQLVMTNENHVHVSTNLSGGDRDEPLTIRGVPFSVSAHVNHVNGRWQIGSRAVSDGDDLDFHQLNANANARYLNRQDLYVHRLDKSWNQDNNPTRTQLEKIEPIVLQAVREWLNTEFHVVADAAYVERYNTITKKLADVAELEAKLAEEKAVLKKLEDELAFYDDILTKMQETKQPYPQG